MVRHTVQSATLGKSKCSGSGTYRKDQIRSCGYPIADVRVTKISPSKPAVVGQKRTFPFIEYRKDIETCMTLNKVPFVFQSAATS